MDLTQYSRFSALFATALILKSALTTYLDYRNMVHIRSHQNQVPEKFKDIISLENHQKAANYTIDKIRTKKVFSFINLILLLGLTLMGGIDYLTLHVPNFGLGPVMTGLIFFAVLSFITSIPEIFHSYYSTFVIEEKYGFNKMTLGTFISDLIKGTIVMGIIGGIILAAILSMIYFSPTYWWLFSFFIFIGFQLLIMFIFPTFIAPLFNKFTPLPEGEIKETILKLLEKVGFRASGLFIMDASKRSSHGNAYFTGFGKTKRIVFFDTLIERLDVQEIEAVLAHELGHMKLNHIKKMIVKFFIVSFFAFCLLGFLIRYAPFLNGHGLFLATPHSSLALLMLVSGTYTYFFTPLSSMMSRKHEFEADAFAAKYSEGKKLITALIKLHRDNASVLEPDPMYSKFYYSHPPALERIEHLEKL